MKMNFSGWKKHSEDKTHAILQNHEGHQIKIYKGALSPKLRGQLAAIAMVDGGKAKPNDPGIDPRGPAPLAKGGRIRHYADGTEDAKPSPTPSKTPWYDLSGGHGKPVPNVQNPESNYENSKDQAYKKAQGGEIKDEPTPQPSDKIEKDEDLIDSIKDPDLKRSIERESLPSSSESIPHYAQGTDSASSDDASATPAPVTINIGGGAPQMPSNLINPNAGGGGGQIPGNQVMQHDPQGDLPYGTSGQAATPQPPQQQIPSTPQQQPETSQPVIPGAPASAPDPYGYGEMSDMYHTGEQMQESGALGAGQAEAQTAGESAKQLGRAAAYFGALGSQLHDNSARIMDEVDNVAKDVASGQIDPNRFWNSKDSGARVATALGLILGGIGSGATGGPNQALQFLQSQIDRDIDAQKANLGNKQTLLGQYLNQYKDLQTATDALRLTHMNVIQTRLQQQAMKTNNQAAIYRAMQNIGQIKAEMAPLASKIATNKTLMDASQAVNDHPDMMPQLLQAADLANPELGKNLRARYVPGVGLATEAVTPDIRDKIVAHQKLDTAIKDLQQWTKTHTTAVPGTADYNIGSQKALTLQALVREPLLRTVYREGEQPLLDKLVNSNPGNLLKAFNTEPKLQELFRSNASQYNTLKKAYGLPVSQEEQMQAEGKPMTKVVNGITYRRGPNGEAIPVK